jgi:hypothetical protein
MTEFIPKASTGGGRLVNYQALDTEASLLDVLCLATTGESEAVVRRERQTKVKPTQQSIEIVRRLIEFIQAL